MVSRGCGHRMCRGEGAVELPGDVALERTHDFLRGADFSAATGNIGTRRCVGANPNDDDGGQRPVEPAVAAAIESVPQGVS